MDNSPKSNRLVMETSEEEVQFKSGEELYWEEPKEEMEDAREQVRIRHLTQARILQNTEREMERVEMVDCMEDEEGELTDDMEEAPYPKGYILPRKVFTLGSKVCPEEFPSNIIEAGGQAAPQPTKEETPVIQTYTVEGNKTELEDLKLMMKMKKLQKYEEASLESMSEEKKTRIQKKKEKLMMQIEKDVKKRDKIWNEMDGQNMAGAKQVQESQKRETEREEMLRQDRERQERERMRLQDMSEEELEMLDTQQPPYRQYDDTDDHPDEREQFERRRFYYDDYPPKLKFRWQFSKGHPKEADPTGPAGAPRSAGGYLKCLWKRTPKVQLWVPPKCYPAPQPPQQCPHHPQPVRARPTVQPSVQTFPEPQAPYEQPVPPVDLPEPPLSEDQPPEQPQPEAPPEPQPSEHSMPWPSPPLPPEITCQCVFTYN